MAGDAFRSLSGLALDPLGLRPWELADLTDWQIEGLYLTPAAERADRWERERHGGHAMGDRGDDGQAFVADREDFIAGWVARGKTREQAEAIYEHARRAARG